MSFSNWVWIMVVAMFWLSFSIVFSESPKVIDSQNIGVGLEMRSHQKWYGTASEIVTDKGTFIVEGNFTLIKNNPLVLETLDSGKQRVCDNKINKCASIKE